MTFKSDLAKAFEGVTLNKEKKDDVHCPGQIFRANVSQYYNQYESGKNSGDINIGLTVRLRRLKNYSCPGCKKCGWIFEYLSEINDEDFPVEGIESVENGKAYVLEGVFSPGDYYEGGHDEFDNFRVVEWKEEYIAQGKMAFEKGKKPDDCPYMTGTIKAKQWMDGYIQADAQEAGEAE